MDNLIKIPVRVGVNAPAANAVLNLLHTGSLTVPFHQYVSEEHKLAAFRLNMVREITLVCEVQKSGNLKLVKVEGLEGDQ